MKKKVGIIKRVTCIALVFLLSINSFAAIVSDNDGSAFITKSEFDALKSSFQSQIDSYNNSIDSKIDGAIASYLAGIKLSTNYSYPPIFDVSLGTYVYAASDKLKRTKPVNPIANISYSHVGSSSSDFTDGKINKTIGGRFSSNNINFNSKNEADMILVDDTDNKKVLGIYKNSGCTVNGSFAMQGAGWAGGGIYWTCMDIGTSYTTEDGLNRFTRAAFQNTENSKYWGQGTYEHDEALYTWSKEDQNGLYTYRAAYADTKDVIKNNHSYFAKSSFSWGSYPYGFFHDYDTNTKVGPVNLLFGKVTSNEDANVYLFEDTSGSTNMYCVKKSETAVEIFTDDISNAPSGVPDQLKTITFYGQADVLLNYEGHSYVKLPLWLNMDKIVLKPCNSLNDSLNTYKNAKLQYSDGTTQKVPYFYQGLPAFKIENDITKDAKFNIKVSGGGASSWGIWVSKAPFENKTLSSTSTSHSLTNLLTIDSNTKSGVRNKGLSFTSGGSHIITINEPLEKNTVLYIRCAPYSSTAALKYESLSNLDCTAEN